MKNTWWKILSILILLYVFVFGMLIPLKPGVERLSKGTAKAGDTLSLTVFGYNTFFKDATDVRLWLKADSAHVVEGKNIRLVTDTELEVTFVLPKFFPTKEKIMETSLIVDSDADGAFVYPTAITVVQDSINQSLTNNLFTDKIEKLHETPFISYPFRNILSETIRNTYFHVPLWFGMIILFGMSGWQSRMHLKNSSRLHDLKAVAYANVGVLFGILGIITGAIWAKNTWGQYWSFDVKQNMAAVSLLIYMAYFVLRGSLDDLEKRARIGAVYNIFAFFAMIPLLFVIPRLTNSLHPGNGGNPGFGGEDLDNTMRLVFYPAIIGFTLLGAWMAQIWYRAEAVKEAILEE